MSAMSDLRKQYGHTLIAMFELFKKGQAVEASIEGRVTMLISEINQIKQRNETVGDAEISQICNRH